MDPVSHAAFGRTLVGVVSSTRWLEEGRRGCVVAAVIGSLSPDVDAVLMPFGWDRYLRAHEAGIHTIAGTLVCAVMTAAIMRLFAGSTRFSALVLSAWIGAASHILLDLLSSGRLRPGWPLIDTVVSLPVVAMADPWLLALCVAGPVAMRVAGRSRERRAGVAALALIAAFLLAKAALGTLAVANYNSATDRSADPVLARVIEAKWGSLNSWHVFDRTAKRVRAWSASANGGIGEELSWPLGPETPLISKSRSLSTVRNFLRAHELGFAVTLPRDQGRTLVLWSDIRFCWDATLPGARALQPIVGSDTGDTQIACALWFGGELDAAGAPRLEIVKVGGFTQTRVPAR